MKRAKKKSAAKKPTRRIKEPKPTPKIKPAAKKPRAINFVSGPSRSRRFGFSVNVNFGTPGHSCGWNCVYCPWRAPGEKITKAPETAPLNAIEILASLRDRLAGAPEVETVILGGSSEPTTHPEFADIVAGVLELKKELQGKWITVCLSNGEGLSQPSVRTACNRLDETWVKLDCAEDVLFGKTNKPSPRSLKSVRALATPLKQMRRLCVQSTLWRYPDKPGFQNWSADNLSGLLALYQELKPQVVHLVTVKRRRVFEGVQPVSYDELEAFALRVAELGIPVEAFA
ncbi:MAG: hypothetical protein A2X94_04420 [Bdellovibrionales bacterium GWB1_55_8]|nr:MAG: hypothetical protein A2X94_04420 [Bdellovibrionales bacterium GWB1_55_8]